MWPKFLIRYGTLLSLLVTTAALSDEPSWMAALGVLILLAAFIAEDCVFEIRAGLAKTRRETDEALYRKLIALLSYEGTVLYVKETDFGKDYVNLMVTGAIGEFSRFWQDEEHNFHDSKLQLLMSNLLDASTTLTRSIGLNTFPTGIEGKNRVPVDWRDTSPERYKRVGEELITASDKFISAHQKFVAAAKKTLGV